MKLQLKQLSLLERLWLLGPVALWFSYQPLVRFGQDQTSYYELSVTAIYLFVLGLAGVPAIWRARKQLVPDRAVSVASGFVGLSVLSLLWTQNFTRGVLTVGMLGLLYLVFLAVLAEQERLKKLLPLLGWVLVGSAVVVAVLAFVQVIAGIWLPGAETLLCAGCAADQFGFARPNVFAIEPQFLGSLFIAPLLLLLRNYLKGTRNISALISFVVISSALFLTLSRGAIFAFAIGVVVLIALNASKIKYAREPALALVAAFALALVVQGTAAALNPRVDTSYYGAISASINQLTLGKVSLPALQTTQPQPTEAAPAFGGYVEESTNTRVNLTSMALGAWSQTPARIAFGVGIGGSGAAIHAAYPDTIDAREIIQNEYIEVLLEYGLAGLAVFVALLGGYMWGTRTNRWAWALLVAYAFQWWFFSGYPNTLHVYLVLIAVYVGFRQRASVRRA
jgi:hypothetical protein